MISIEEVFCHGKHAVVTTLGELLIDFTDNGRSSQGNILFEANPCSCWYFWDSIGKLRSVIFSFNRSS